MDHEIELRQIFPYWEKMYDEIQQVLMGAEKIYHAFRNDTSVPKIFIASPYILVLERELIQFCKHKFPKYLLKIDSDRDLESYQSSYAELKEMLFKGERISLGHFVNWMGRIDKEADDELFKHFVEFTRLLDPNREIFNKHMVQLLSLKILKYRKYCVHISRKEKWLGIDQVEEIRRLVLFDFDNRGVGLLPKFIALEENLLNFLAS